jgi:hypothetical protein
MPGGARLGLVILATSALTAATAVASHYLFMYLFTGHW